MTAKIRYTCYSVLTVVTVGMQAFARTIVVPPQPVSPYADTEVSTNVVINRADISYSDLHFAFAGTPTNSLELAFGTDVNTNGVLEAEEIASRFGWRSGRYFIENAESGEVLDGAASNSSQSFSIDLHLEVRYGSQQVRSMTVSGVDAAAFGAVVSNTPPTWIWRRDWNLMRATRRGTDLPSDWIEYNASHRGFAIRLR
jgi:hypothetical protein